MNAMTLLRGAALAVLCLSGCSSDSGVMMQTPSDGGPRFDASPPDSGLLFLDTSCLPELDEVEACGGDVTGAAWTYFSACSAFNPFSPFENICQGAISMGLAYTNGGTLRFDPNGTFTRQANTRMTAMISVPMRCTILVGGCTGVPAAILSVVPNTTADCTANAGGGCDCNVALDLSTDDTGTYTIAADTITVDNGRRVSQYWYCASDTVMKYRGIEGNPDRVSHVLTR